MIRSFSLGNNWPPEYPLFPGSPIRYHYLFYLLVGMLERLGLRIDYALNIPSALGMFALLSLIMLISYELFRSKRIAALAVLFFLFNGSLAFLQFFEKYPLSLNTVIDVVQAREFPAFAPWDQRDILAFWNLNIYTNQRHLAVGLGIVLVIMYVLLRLERGQSKHTYALSAGIGLLTGLLPLLHQPALVIVAVLFICYFFLFARLRKSLLVAGIISAIVVLPQLYVQPRGSSAITWYPGFYTHDNFSLLRFLYYWWQNIGLHLLFIPIGFLIIPNRGKKALFPLVVLFIITNLFQFSKELAASHKFLNFSLLLGQILTAYVTVAYLDRIRLLKPLLLRIVLLGYLLFLLFLLTFSGIIDLFVIVNDRKLLLADLPANDEARWFASYTPPNAVVLNHTYLYHPASIAGRKIFLGWPYFSWSAGYDTDSRWLIQKQIYAATTKETLCTLLGQHAIAYFTVDDHIPDQDEPHPSALIHQELEAAFTSPGSSYKIFATQQVCSETDVSENAE